MVFTGANVPIGKAIVSELAVYPFLAIRFAIASAALLAISSSDERRDAVRIARQFPVTLLLLSLVGSVLFTVLMMEGTKRTSAVNAGIVAATLPAVVAVIAVVVLRHKLTLSAIICIALSVAGIGIIQAAATGDGAAAAGAVTAGLAGNALVFAAVVCEAVFVAASRGIASRLSAIALSLAVSVASLAFSIPVLVWSFDAAALANVSGGVMGLVVWYALSSSVFCTILWYLGARTAPTWQAGLATAAIPLTAVVVSATWLGESLSFAQVAGGTLVIAAILAGALIGSSSPDRQRP